MSLTSRFLTLYAKTLPPNKVIFRVMGWRSWTSAQFKDTSQRVAHKTSTISLWPVLDQMTTSTLQGRLGHIIFVQGNTSSARKESSLTTKAETRHERQQLSVSGRAECTGVSTRPQAPGQGANLIHPQPPAQSTVLNRQ